MMSNSLFKSSLIALLMILIIVPLCVHCDDHDDKPHTPTPYSFPVLPEFPTPVVPAENPMTLEGIELGRHLFYDGRLSGRIHADSLMSCGSCHVQANAFECGMNLRFADGHPRGMPTKEFPTGMITPHVMLPVVNLAYNNTGYMWTGFLEKANTMTGIPGYNFDVVQHLEFKNLEAFTYMAIVAPHEMNGKLEKTVDIISSDAMYGPLFRNAFGTEAVNIDRISMAVSQFIRSIISYRSLYHQWLRGEVQLSAEALRGYELFFSERADCFHCHGGTALLTNFEYFNNGKDASFANERDRSSITGMPWDKGAYRAPSLINVALNGPYMHDGRFKTLDQVIDFYSEGVVYSPYISPMMKYVHQGGVQLSQDEKADLKAFLLTLTDEALLTDPAFAPPAALGQWSTK